MKAFELVEKIDQELTDIRIDRDFKGYDYHRKRLIEAFIEFYTSLKFNSNNGEREEINTLKSLK